MLVALAAISGLPSGSTASARTIAAIFLRIYQLVFPLRPAIGLIPTVEYLSKWRR